MSQTVRHNLPLIVAGQAQKEVTHNEALAAIDSKLQISLLSRQLLDPPVAPDTGDAYIIPTVATGAWAGKEGQVALWDGFGWRFTMPSKGTVAWVADEAGCIVWDDEWSSGWPVGSLRIGAREVLGAMPVSVPAPSGGLNIDVEARTAIAAIVSALRAQGLIS